MARTIDQIESHIEDSRADLRSNLDELGAKVRSAVDWKERFRSNPGAGLALAFAGGLVLARLLRAGATTSHPVEASIGVRRDPKSEVPSAWDKIQNALIGVVASKVGNTLADALPGFKEQLRTREDDVDPVDGGSRPH